MRLRRATGDDAEAIHAVAAARDIADVGRPDWTLDDVRAALARGGIAALDGDRIVGFGLASGSDAKVEVHPDACGRGIGTALREEVERRAGGPAIRQEIMSANSAARELLEAAGYTRDDRYWLMVRELEEAERPAYWPAPASPRRLQRPADDRAAYELVSAAMRDNPGNTERTFEEWSERALGAGLEPELSTIVDGSAIALCQRRDGEGYVDYVAVARESRGRGLGKALLQESFHLFAAAGLGRAALWVNGRNEFATRLYRAAGMDVALSADRYVKCLKPR
jgi:mycothiol synthase